MSRIAATFSALKAQNKTGLVTFITAGDPGPALTVPLMHALVAGGADGAIVVDYPPEECEEFASAMRANGLDLIFLLAPTSTPERIAQVARVGSGFSYYVSLKGVTGAGHIDTAEVAQRLAAIRQHVKLPIGVGFGIRDAATARAVAEVADAVVIGSRIIQELEATPEAGAAAAVQAFVAGIRRALDGK